MSTYSHKCTSIVPPAPELQEKIIKSKEALEKLRSSGKNMTEYKNGKDMLPLDTIMTIINRPAKTRPDTFVSPVKELTPVIGVKKAIVLLVDFSDEPATKSKSHFESLLFDASNSGSMRSYYKEVSYNKLDVQGEVHGWFRAPHPKTYYTNNNYSHGSYPRNAQKLVEDVINLANPSVNFSSFDNGGDSFIEAVIVIAAGSGAEQTGNKDDIWSHAWGINTKTVDGKKISRYFMGPEDGNVGVMSHELGHLLMKWPDLYDTDYSSRGTGRWDLMAGGSWNNGGNSPAHPMAWLKIKAGWINPVVIANAAQSITLTPYTNNALAFKLPANGNPSSKEYFILSNRRKSGFDQYLPGEGLIIEHVDENQTNNTNENHYLVDIEQADGSRHLNIGSNSGDQNDPFPTASNNKFDNSSTPNSKKYDNSDSQVYISNIQRSGNNIIANLKDGTPGPTWIHNKTIVRTYSSSHSKNAWAIIGGVSGGWRKLKSNSADGVTNMFDTICEAQANNRKVDVYLDDTTIYRIVGK